jgi:poly(3-hydroxybutyrate) depolymerase
MIESQFCIDLSREYVIGFSNGAMMTEYMACSSSSRYAAVVPFHGQRQRGYDCVFADDDPIPIMNVYGLNDAILPYNGVPGYSSWYFRTVDEVSALFADHNGCNYQSGWQNVATVTDGMQGWECHEYNDGCRQGAVVRQCSWNGDHNYMCPVVDPYTGWSTCPDCASENLGFNVAWNFVSQFQRLVPLPNTTEMHDHDHDHDDDNDSATLASLTHVYYYIITFWSLFMSVTVIINCRS